MKPNSTTHKCTESDCRRFFSDSVEGLRWLCYTLTGEAELTEQALDAALAQSLQGAGQVFSGWMPSWTRRLIIKFCIASARPAESPLGQCAYPIFPMTFGSMNSERIRGLLDLPAATLQEKLLRLDGLSRFVFVLRALEGYSRRDTALLLNVDDRACEWTYVWAIGTLGSNAPSAKGEEFNAVPSFARQYEGNASLEPVTAI